MCMAVINDHIHQYLELQLCRQWLETLLAFLAALSLADLVGA